MIRKLMIPKEVIIVTTILFLLIGPTFALDKDGNFESKTEQDEYVVLTLNKMAKQMSSQAPLMIDEETQMSYVIALDKTLNFTMRLVNLNSNEIDATYLNKFVWGNVNYIACKNKATRDLIDLGVSYIYLYFGKDNRFVTRVVLDHYKCN